MASNPRGIASAGSCQRITRSPRRPIRSGVRRWQSGSVLVANRRKPSCRLQKWSQHPQSGVAANRDRQPRSSLRAAARSEHRKPSGLYPVASVLYPIHREGALRGRKGRGTMAGGPTHVFDYPSGAARFYIMDDFCLFVERSGRILDQRRLLVSVSVIWDAGFLGERKVHLRQPAIRYTKILYAMRRRHGAAGSNWVRRRSPPAMKRRAIGPGGRQTGGPARPLPDELLRQGPRGQHRQPRCGLERPRRADAKGAGISHARLLRAEWPPSPAENAGNNRVRRTGRISRRRRSSIAP